jgi:hypothetical protein
MPTSLRAIATLDKSVWSAYGYAGRWMPGWFTTPDSLYAARTRASPGERDDAGM